MKNLFLLLFITFSVLSKAQQPLLFDQINDKNGRSFGTITGVVQDSTGYIWFSSRNGLYRYDGYDYIQYKNIPKNPNSLPFSDITNLYYDHKKTLWLKHLDLIAAFQKNKVLTDFKAITHLTYDSEVQTIDDSNDNIWIGTGKSGLIKYNRTKKTIEKFGKDIDCFHPYTYRFIDSIAKKNTEIAQIIEVSNNQNLTKSFELTKKTEILVACVGEIDEWGEYDFGSISNEKGEVWKMNINQCKHAGGSPKNKLLLELITLPKGHYQLHYVSDNSNSYKNWANRNEAPDKISFYGIKLFDTQTITFNPSLMDSYHNKNNILDNNVQTMTLDKSGILHVVTEKGIDIYQPKSNTFKHIELNFSKLFLTQVKITCAKIDNQIIWIGTDNGLLKYNLKRNVYQIYLNTPENPTALTENYITCIMQDKYGNLWLGTTKGLTFFEVKKQRFYKYTADSKNRLYDNLIFSIFEDRTGTIWLGTRLGLNKLVRPRFNYSNLGIEERFYQYPILSENTNKLWYKGIDNTLVLFDKKKETSTSYQIPASIFLKNSNGGKDFLINNIINENQNSLWLIIGNGIFLFDKNQQKIVSECRLPDFKNGSDKNTNKISTLVANDSKSFWLIGLNGIYLYTKNSNSLSDCIGFEQIKTNANIDNFVTYALKDKQGLIWFRTVKGISIFNPTKKTISQIVEYEPDMQFTSQVEGNILEDNKGNIWIPILPKLYKFSKNNLQPTVYQYNESGNVSNCRMIQNSEQRFWIYTDNGLFCFDTTNSEFRKYTTNAGLADNTINGIVDDKRGNLWISTLKGLTRFNKKTENCTNFFRDNDFITHKFIGNTQLEESKTSEILFFTSSGIVSYFPDSINTKTPPLAITNFTILKRPYDLDTLVQKDKKVHLKYSENSLVFEFSALDFTNPDNNRYAYKLDNYDTEWNECDAYNRRAVYNKLSPGTYTFRLRACNSDDICNEKIMAVIVIKPPFWSTAWFRALMVLAGLAAIYGFIKIREQKLQHDKRVLERIVVERTAKIEQQKQELEVQRDEMMRQRDHIAKQNQEITDSIHYASRIQSAILPSSEMMLRTLPQHFVLYKPRDIVSGDFYWYGQKKNRTIVIVADCTGHGVPGAFMSMLGAAFLNEIVIKEEIVQPDSILNKLREYIMTSLKQTGKEGESKDGMDISLCSFDFDNRKLYFAGAYNPLYLVRNDEVIVLKADKMPIGIYYGAEKEFGMSEIELQDGDIFYMSSDGFLDQFGGDEGKKFMTKRFKELLLEIHKEDMKHQAELLQEALTNWIGTRYAQIDDIAVIGIRYTA